MTIDIPHLYFGLLAAIATGILGHGVWLQLVVL